MSSLTILKREPIIVHYINSSKTETLCGLEKIAKGGPSWVTPKAPGSKKDVNYPTCIDAYQKALRRGLFLIPRKDSKKPLYYIYAYLHTFTYYNSHIHKPPFFISAVSKK